MFNDPTLRRLLREWLLKPPVPGGMYLVNLREIPGMSNQFEATVALPALAEGEAGEVVSRQFTKQINGQEPVVETIGVDQAQHVFACVQGDVIHLELRNIDDAGNVSPTASVLDFTVVDTTPPEAPGAMTVALRELP